MHCVAGAQAVLAMSEATCRALCYSYADCLSGVGTYLQGTVLQWGRLFKQCRNLPAVHCVTVVKAVLAMSESTCQALCYSGAGCLRSVRTYLLGTCVTVVQTVSVMSEPTFRGTVLQGCRLFKWCQTLPARTVLQWCRLVKWCRNLPVGHCVTVVQAV